VFKAVAALNVVPISAFVSSSLVDCFGFLFHQQGCKPKSVIGKLGYDGPNRPLSRNKKPTVNFEDPISDARWYFDVINCIMKKTMFCERQTINVL